MNFVLDVFNSFDSKKRYSLRDISKYLKDKINDNENYQYDIYALDLFDLFDLSDDLILKSQRLEDIGGGEGFFCHLEEQVQRINNSYVLARYYELLWMNKNEEQSSKKNENYRKLMIENICLAIKEKKVENDYRIESYLEKALDNSLKKDKTLEIVADLIINRGIEHENRSWAYNLLQKNNKIISKDLICKSLKEIENCFFETIEKLGDMQEILECSKILLKKHKKNSDELNKILHIIFHYFNSNLESSLTDSYYLNEVLFFVRELKIKNLEVLEPLKTLSLKLGEGIEYASIKHEISYSKEELEEFKNYIIKESFLESIKNLKNFYLNQFYRLKRDLTKQDNIPLRRFFSTSVRDNKGRVIANVDKEEDKIKYEIASYLPLNYLNFNFCIKEIFNEFKSSKKDIKDLVERSEYLTESDRKIINKSLEYYISGDNLVFLHLVMPRIENIFRNILEAQGGSVIGEIKSNGFNYKTLNGILNDALINEMLLEDTILYIKLILSDDLGLNIRNNLAHGIIEINNCEQVSADMVLHILLFLLFF